MTEAAVVILLRREREVVDAFRVAGATDPTKALSLSDLNLEQTVAVQRLQQRAVLREAGPGLFYLDEPSWLALHRMRRRVIVVAVVALIVALLLMLFRNRLT